ncbi:isochorismate synthase [Erwinia sp. P7711]|uniref:isochorismate synthase n=1 Tax=Erwinia sp. P7711 TaxID=3141451 RepID=UPI003191EA76
MPLSFALLQLQRQLDAVSPCQQGFLHFSAALDSSSEGLAWLAAQSVWPQFYWQAREGNETLMALGEVARAETLAQAARLLNTLPEAGCLVGVNEFALQRCYLFLPRLLWRRERLNVYLYGDLYQQAQATLRMLSTLQPAVPLPALPTCPSACQHSPDKQGWGARVALALQAIKTGELEKVVLARATDVSFPEPLSPHALLAASREVNHHCYHFLLAQGPHQAFVGSSPERLYHRQGLALRTEALAGTCENSKDALQASLWAEALFADEKNRRENGLVVEDICQQLHAVTQGLDVAPAQIVRLRKVQHLRREIQASLHQPDDKQILQQLQPTAAVAGLPRKAALNFIHHHEPFSRNWYAGSVGWLSAGESEFSVALRSAWVEKSSVRFYAGAGIVAGSEADLEWQEINHKASGLAGLAGVEIAEGSCPKSK